MAGDGAEQPIPVSTASAKSVAVGSTRPDHQKRRLEDEGDNCRICRGEATTEQPLFYPCKCSGSIRFVHQECLMEWLAHSQKKYCELCKTPFTFTKLYDRSMPPSLPLALFLQQVVIHTVSGILRHTRYVAVTFVWLCWLPWSIRQVWRGLFWLADGSWVMKAQLHEAALADLSAAFQSSPNSTTSTFNATVQSAAEIISDQAQLQTSLFSGFVGLFTGDLLLVELAKLVFPSLRWFSQHLVSTNTSDDPLVLLTMDRQPSILSNIGFIGSLTNHRLLNSALVDVLEGQLVCLLIVVAFILVFLIREWVINQQPIANMPDPDHAVEAARVGNLQDDVARAAPQRRRDLGRRAEEHQQRPDGEHRPVPLLGERHIALPRQRQRQNPNVAEVARDLQVPEAHSLPAELVGTATSNTVPSPASSASTLSEAEFSDSDAWVDEDARTDARPPLPARGTFDNITEVQRRIEEGSIEAGDISIRQDEGNERHESRRSSSDLSDSATQAEYDLWGVPQNLIYANPNLAETSQHQTRARPDGLIYPPQSPILEHSMTLPDAQPTMSGAGSAEELEVAEQPNASSSEAAAGAMQSDDTASTDSAAVNTLERTTQALNLNPTDQADDTTWIRRTGLYRIFDWFWELDDDTQSRLATTQARTSADEQVVVENVSDEAPFVPVHHQEPEAVEVAALEAPPPPPPPPAQEPNMLFGVDLNNPEAMEDAEDLDGILELIGMQGPLAGMAQNVFFCEFLITLTIAASVWLPYMWGKFALLVLANPVAFFIRVPLFLAARFADFAVDMAIFVISLLTLAFAASVKAFLGLAGDHFHEWRLFEFVDTISSDMTRASGSRLENTLSKALIGMRPDLPTFSLRSHYALRVIESRVQHMWAGIHVSLASWIHHAVLQLKDIIFDTTSRPQGIWQHITKLITGSPKHLAAFVLYLSSQIRESLAGSSKLSTSHAQTIDTNLARWNAQDKFIAILLGYLFFACIGYLYLGAARLILGLRSEDKVEGVVADSLRQAGGVVKVVVIIGIEMIVFPLYCGLLLDAALMPLFEGVTLQTRIAFMFQAPITALFVHWFIGTCYMFHFALFVSMCRKIFRKGVLYFIRDPDDPTFHPVRDVLERPVMTQLGKIAFSGFIYGGLVYLCLGGVVYLLSCMPGILPIHWSTNQPQLALPVDIIFYNFLLPFILRKTRPSKKIAAMYEWWFRGCAHGLRLTNFLFGEERPEEKVTHAAPSLWSKLVSKGPESSAFMANSEVELLIADSGSGEHFVRDGGYVRAPASDSVRIPKGHKVFLEVNQKNERVDGEEDKNKGMHGSQDDRFIHVYVPPNFQARIATFIVLLWLFAAATGVLFTIGPLLLGRLIIQPLAAHRIPPNDLYALTVGLHAGTAVLYATAFYSRAMVWLKENTNSLRERLNTYFYPTTKYLLGLFYLSTAICILPGIFSLLVELYIHVPLYEYLNSEWGHEQFAESSTPYLRTLPPTIFLLQTWTIGLVLVRVILREGLGDAEISRPARAIKAIVQRGYLDPDIRLATRALLLPATILAATLWLTPLALGRILISVLHISIVDQRVTIYRYSYPGLAGMIVSIYLMLAMKRRIAIWRTKIRDEVYLVGERLHNYQEARDSNTKAKSRSRVRSGRVDAG